MTSGPVMVQVLEGENAVLENRNLMGATDPREAEIGTIRADFADSIDANAVHGSDSIETAKQEINFFFPGFGNTYGFIEGYPVMNFMDLTRSELARLCLENGQPKFRAFQLTKWVHNKGVQDFAKNDRYSGFIS